MNNHKIGMSSLGAVLLVAAIVAIPVVYFLKKQMSGTAVKNRTAGTVIFLNGTSSAGKTSIIKELQKIYGDSFTVVIGDDFLATYVMKHPQPESMTPDAYQRQMLKDAFLHIKQLSLHSENVFVDFAEVNAKHYCAILDCKKVVKILVYCPLDVLVDRVAERNRSGNAKETRTLSMPFEQFMAIYKLQDSLDEMVVDRIATSRIRYALLAVEQEVRQSMQGAGVKQEDIEKNIQLLVKPFVEQFKLDTLAEVVLVPRNPWDLIVNTGIHSSEEIAHSITEFLSKRTENAMNEQQSSSGTFLAKDKLGSPVILKWIKTGIQAPEYAAGMKSIAEIASQAFAAVELQFLRQHPEAVMQDEYLKQYVPFFEKGAAAVDWKAVENKVQSNLKQMHEMDLSGYGPDVLKPYINDVYFFVIVKDQATEAPLGYINFSIAPEYVDGDIKVTGIGIAPSAQNRGLGKLLMSSIFKIVPQIQRIFLCTRITNENALRAYHSWGFTPDLNPIQEPNSKIIREHWSFMEYRVGSSDILQKMAGTLE